MREIKYKVWDKILMCWSKNSHKWINCGDGVITPDSGNRYIFIQFTGLKDKNGEEIYDGDVIQWDCWDEPILVSFWYGKFVVVYAPTCRSEIEGECQTDDLCTFEKREIEIIGNMYENPELLEADNG